eukprot:g7323.t1
MEEEVRNVLRQGVDELGRAEDGSYCFYLHDEAVEVDVDALLVEDRSGTASAAAVVVSGTKTFPIISPSARKIKNVLTIYGSPYQPEFCDWGFNLPRGAPCRQKWDQIPQNTDILVTHGPPLGRGDLTVPAKVRAGCLDLLETVADRVRPSLHVFGHIHEGYGASFDGVSVYVNAATCNLAYRPSNPPVVVELEAVEDVARG